MTTTFSLLAYTASVVESSYRNYELLITTITYLIEWGRHLYQSYEPLRSPLYVHAIHLGWRINTI